MSPVRSGGLFLCLWADKVSSLAVLPAGIVYAYYFIWLAPEFRGSVARLHSALDSVPISGLRPLSDFVFLTAASAVRRTAVVGAVLLGLTGSLLSAWPALMITILCFQLDRLGERWAGPLIGVAHVAFCTWWPWFDLILLAVAFVLAWRAWRTPSYALFWRPAAAA